MSAAPKYVFITGGVVSSLGKGIVAASLGRLLKARGLQVQAQKFDPYLNVDPGTMSPFQHGEVFVTEDGAETDLDIGHYERFVDENLSRNSSHTAGGIWDAVLLLPYDLREMAMLGDAGSNALGALLGLNSVKRFTGRGQWVAIGALAGLTLLGERKSIGAWIERTPGLSWIDGLGRL